jgi:O-antigen/teichoic acid export membrane protein
VTGANESCEFPAANSVGARPEKRPLWGLNQTAANSLYNIATAGAAAAGKSVLFLIGPILLDPALFGVYSYFFWIASVAIALGSAGTVIAAQRFTCHFSDAGQQPRLVRFLIASTLSLTGIAAAVLLLLPRSLSPGPALLIAVVAFAVSGSIVAVQQAESQAHHDFRSPFIGESLSQVLRFAVLGVLRLVQWFIPVLFILLDAVVALTKSGILLLGRSRTFAERSTAGVVVELPKRMSILRTCILPVTAITILDTILWQRGEIFFLGFYSGASSVAYFGGAAQIGQVFVLAPAAIFASLLPRMAEKSRESRDVFNDAMNRVLNMAALWVLPLYCTGIVLGPVLVRLWKPQYAPVIGILPMIMLGRMALLLSAPVALALYSSGRERAVLLITFFSSLVALTNDWFLISHFGLLGAANACAINQTLTALVTGFVGMRYLSYKIKLRNSTIAVLAVVAIAQAVASQLQQRTIIALGGLVISVAVLFFEPFMSSVMTMMLPRRRHEL